ncbi:hypothetical protein [Nocardia seriolae]|uniref:Uncharacterized protein n=1 Tax=Nocardia seriolae TaxID=37332 RepID=A0ABC9Z028_9NOCA|nr:hypothetical protein [Nocardia seriolae]APB01566.1 hypothetical protein NS506_07546 [Nocardia seriolae]OJF78360.1 hypothetical protein NS14008_02900 [Nocardia seriolae]QOW31416.1 hypothetical protein IMZ23_25390 [Nocardia seriolae]QUN19028.1 hypothetical protein KEC46_06475 [Nocardia seriolae]WKY51741.1 hypothetical protein Q5P07_33260 [Nocardia seriolae]
MRHGQPSDDELRANFDEVLAEVLTGRGVHTATGLDDDTEDALWAIAEAHPNATPELIAAARQAFAGQLDGSNAERWAEEMDNWFDEREERKAARDQQGPAEQG